MNGEPSNTDNYQFSFAQCVGKVIDSDPCLKIKLVGLMPEDAQEAILLYESLLDIISPEGETIPSSSEWESYIRKRVSSILDDESFGSSHPFLANRISKEHDQIDFDVHWQHIQNLSVNIDEGSLKSLFQEMYELLQRLHYTNQTIEDVTDSVCLRDFYDFIRKLLQVPNRDRVYTKDADAIMQGCLALVVEMYAYSNDYESQNVLKIMNRYLAFRAEVS